jgi:hypothetical protein
MCCVALVVTECRNNSQVLHCGRQGLKRQFIVATCAKEHANLRFVVSNRGSDTDAILYTFQFLSDCPSRQSHVKWKYAESSKACPVSD